MDKVKDTINNSGVGDKVSNLANEAGNYMQRESVDASPGAPRGSHCSKHRTANGAHTVGRVVVGRSRLHRLVSCARTVGKEKYAIFVGLWAPTFLIFGLYNKMIKLRLRMVFTHHRPRRAAFSGTSITLAGSSLCYSPVNLSNISPAI